MSLITSCASHGTATSRWHQENGRLKVLSTLAMIHDIVVQIGGEEIDGLVLIRAELDPHSYELVKGDDEKFARADLIFYNGLGLEHGVSLRQNLEGNPHAVAVADPLLQKEGCILTVDGQKDPHVWMDIALWMQIIPPIATALSEKDPAHQTLYWERAEVLKQKLQERDEEIYKLLQAIPLEKRYLVTSHDAFHYFTRHYLAAPGEKEWEPRCQAPEGLAPEAQMSVSDLLALLSHIEAFKIPVLFPESNVSKDALRKIVAAAQERGLDVRLCHETLYSDSMGKAGSYLEMITHNATVIANEMGKE